MKRSEINKCAVIGAGKAYIEHSLQNARKAVNQLAENTNWINYTHAKKPERRNHIHREIAETIFQIHGKIALLESIVHAAKQSVEDELKIEDDENES